ncbi:hypothetical protein GcM1_250088 [Golovinomyces cichoracearum]|uniref:Uncharacterized protein n=1 Tax=Golovinomyces cichoracearum TaxID=62708 RepID=A0A420IAU5_9PEZI|nr:hypothetical protein GcM1_250088 [Golovinomyces cichoracearum]
MICVIDFAMGMLYQVFYKRKIKETSKIQLISHPHYSEKTFNFVKLEILPSLYDRFADNLGQRFEYQDHV